MGDGNRGGRRSGGQRRWVARRGLRGGGADWVGAAMAAISCGTTAKRGVDGGEGRAMHSDWGERIREKEIISSIFVIKS